MSCFYCSQPSALTCDCMDVNLCADHIIDHTKILYRSHSFSRFSQEFSKIQSKLVSAFITGRLNLIRERSYALSKVTCALINRITLLSKAALNDIDNAEKEYLKMIENIDKIDFAKLITETIPLKPAKPCLTYEIEAFFSQNFVEKVNFSENFKSFLGTHSPSYCQLCLSYDNSHVFAGGEDYTIRMWSLSNSLLEHTFIGHLDLVYCVASTREYLISGSFDRTIRLWNLQTKSLHAVLEGHTGGIRCLTTFKNELIISGSQDRSIRVWSIKSLEAQCILNGHADTIREIAIIKNNELMISCSDDKTLKVWNLSTKSEVISYKSKQPMFCICLSHNNNNLYSGSKTGSIFKWDLSNMKVIFSNKCHADKIHKLILSRDDQTLYSCSDDNLIKIWQMDGNLIASLSGHLSFVYGLALTNDERHLVSSSYDTSIKIWSVANRREINTLQLISITGRSLTVSANGQYLAYGSKNDLAVWDMISSKQNCFRGHESIVGCTAISYDCKTILSGSVDGNIRIWFVDNPSKNFLLEFKTVDFPSVALTSDSNTAICGLSDGKIRVCELTGKRKIFDLGKHKKGVDCVAVSSKNTYVVSSSSENIKLWKLSKKTLVHEFNLENIVTLVSILISNDETKIFFNAACGLKILWDIEAKALATQINANPKEFYRDNEEFLTTFIFFHGNREMNKI